ncbi:MAG: XdhC family protein [candidate division Zixibacteria bacterium]|nr:XdhC family protein [candidate division Zixibacteria bacterium]
MPSQLAIKPDWLTPAIDILHAGEPLVVAVVVAPADHARLGERALIRRDVSGWQVSGELAGAAQIPDTNLQTIWSERCGQILPIKLAVGSFNPQERTAQVLLAYHGPAERVWIFGAGHIAQALCPLAAQLGWTVTVCDDRSEYANAARFPKADEILVTDFALGAQRCSAGQNNWAVLVTRGHQHDERILRQLANNAPQYIGMIGSQRRVRSVRQRLSADGIPSGFLEAIHAPIGLPIGADSPGEIALSIAAELVAVRRGADPRTAASQHGANSNVADTSGLLALWETVQGVMAGGRPVALATVVDRRGSAPRGLGAQMAVFADGGTVGTIGGGCGEETIKHAAKTLLVAEGSARLIEVDLTGDPASEIADVCGGRYTVFVERLSPPTS